MKSWEPDWDRTQVTRFVAGIQNRPHVLRSPPVWGEGFGAHALCDCRCEMTNDEVPDDERSPNDEARMTKTECRQRIPHHPAPALTGTSSHSVRTTYGIRHSDFVIPSSLGISSFVIVKERQRAKCVVRLAERRDAVEPRHAFVYSDPCVGRYFLREVR